MVDTIFALSSGRPPAGIAVIRISGPNALEIHRQFTARDTLQPLRVARLAALRAPDKGELLDRALTLIFAGPHSATGEDMVEWHCHGGQAVVRAVQDALVRQGRARQALPGEFTRRAFDNDRIDLNEAEGLADLLSAETEAQRRAALAMADGQFSGMLEEWRTQLLRIGALIEAMLDFSDEDDVAAQSEMSGDRQVRSLLSELRQDMVRAAAMPSAQRLRDGVKVVLAGPPNAGKSTLLNALVGRDAAIVSDIAGTTRDRIDAPVNIKGIPFVFTDTAGLRDVTDDLIEQMGMDRAQQAVERADIVLWLGDPQDAPPQSLVVTAQCDRPGWMMPSGAQMAISAHSGVGMTELVDWLVGQAARWIPGEGDFALHERQLAGIMAMTEALTRALEQADMLLVAEDVRIALDAMDRLVGRSGIEDVLDTLFSRFCVGK
jgi:tRNA modification GTPase